MKPTGRERHLAPDLNTTMLTHVFLYSKKHVSFKTSFLILIPNVNYNDSGIAVHLYLEMKHSIP